MEQPLISVIIPIYNMEAYLARCLDSVLNNTYRNLEVLCVDDGSTDGSAQILRAYAEKDSRIVPILKENGGVSSARNAGLDRMTGEYLTFVDPDDYVHPQYVELLYRALKESGTEISICRIQKVELGETTGSMNMLSYESDAVQLYSFSQVFRDRELRAFCCCKMIRIDPSRKLLFREDMQYGEDILFFREFCEGAETEKAAIIPYTLYYYLQYESSLSKIADHSQVLFLLQVMVQKLLQPNGRDDIYLDHVLKRCISIRYLATYILPDPEYARECAQLLKKIRYKIWKTDEYSLGKKLFYLVSIQSSRFYWLYRIIRDPSMWAWEKMERKKRREGKGNAEASAALEE